MFRRLIRILLCHSAVTLVVCVWLNCCAVTQASCGNYLHTRDGAPRQLLAESSAAVLLVTTPQGLLPPDLPGSVQRPEQTPFRPPCSGPHCRQAPAQPSQIPRLPTTTDSSTQEAGCLSAIQGGSSIEPQSLLAISGTAAAQPGFPPAIEIPPEPAS